jgi:hypothetical protein
MTRNPIQWLDPLCYGKNPHSEYQCPSCLLTVTRMSLTMLLLLHCRGASRHYEKGNIAGHLVNEQLVNESGHNEQLVSEPAHGVQCTA